MRLTAHTFVPVAFNACRCLYIHRPRPEAPKPVMTTAIRLPNTCAVLPKAR